MKEKSISKIVEDKTKKALIIGGLGLAALGGGSWWLSQPQEKPVIQRPSDYDCDDFANQAEAQRFYETNDTENFYELDGDGDGEACETLDQ